MFALLSGEATVIYAVIIGDKPLYALLLAIFGLIFIAIITHKIRNIEDETYIKLNDLEKAE